jgi:hypothetical protein
MASISAGETQRFGSGVGAAIGRTSSQGACAASGFMLQRSEAMQAGHEGWGADVDG